MCAAFVLLLALSLPSLQTAATPAEQRANLAAQHEIDTSPADGNLPSYSLKPADLVKGRHLERVRTTLHFTGELWGVLQLVLLLSLGVIARLQAAVQARLRNRWLQSYAFVALLLIVTELLHLPLALYGHAQSLAYGLSVQSWLSWFADIGKSLLLTWGEGGLILMLLTLTIRRCPRRWWLAFWFASVPITLLGVFVTPYVIDPLFNTFEPLQQANPALVERLEQVAQRGRMNIPADRMFLMKASDKVTTLNAYVTGFGASKRVVVWDTSIAQGKPDEILFLFAHESGHYVLHHIVRGIVMVLAALLPLLYLAHLLLRWCLLRFRRSWGIASHSEWAAAVVLLLIFSVFNVALEPLQSALSRQQEHAADVYGQEAIHGIVQDPRAAAHDAFQVLGATSFDDPNPPRWLEFWTYSHPAIGRRAAFAAHYDPWAAGATPKYFASDR